MGGFDPAEDDMSKRNTPFRYGHGGSFLRPTELKQARADFADGKISAVESKVVAKLTISAPAQFLEQMVMPFAMENTSKYYPNTEKLVGDLAAGHRKVIADVYVAGCRDLQLDDCI